MRKLRILLIFIFVFSIGAIAFADIYVVAVTPGTAAEKADLQVGDIIYSIDNQAVASPEEFTDTVNGLPEGSYIIIIERAGVKRFVTVQLPPLGNSVRLGVSISSSIPGGAVTTVNSGAKSRDRGRRDAGVSSGMSGAAVTIAKSKTNPDLVEATRKVIHKPSDSLSERLTKINTLKYAFIDPDTGCVNFIGTYDPSYASGPIPYVDLLAEALEYPYPSFSLDEGPSKPAIQAINQLFDNELNRVSTDLSYGIKWMQNIMLTILHSQEPIPEKLVIDATLKKLGIEPQELAAYLDLKKSNAEYTSEEQYLLVKNFFYKLFASVGIEERYGKAVGTMSRVLQLMRQGDPDRQLYPLNVELSELLGVSEELQNIKREQGEGLINNETAGRRLFGLFYGGLLKGLGVPASQVDPMVERYRRGPNWDEELAAALDARQVALAKEAFLQHIFKSFVLTQPFLKRMYSLPTVYSGVKLYGMRADSPLTRAMFDADYALKYVNTINPDTAALPGYLSTAEFLSATAERLGRSDELKEGEVRFWIHPGELKLEPFTDNSGVRFSPATVRISAEPMDEASKKKAWLCLALSEYAISLNERYDDYARLYPSLHVMRETEKVLALARWIKQNNFRVDVAKARPVANPVPDQVEGFIELIYVSKASGTTDSIFVCADGGDDFSNTKGNNDGIQVTDPSETTTSDVLEQLAASTSLAEQAARAALDGDNMELARELAENSAEAMTGQLNERLPELAMPTPKFTGTSAKISVAVQAVVSQKTISALERNLNALAQARSQAAAAQSLCTTSPTQSQQAIAASQALEKRSEYNLQWLQYLLILYRVAPAQLPVPTMVRVLDSLDPSQPTAQDEAKNAAIKSLLDIENKLMDIRKKIKTMESTKENAAAKFKDLQSQAAAAKPQEKQDMDQRVAEALAALQRAEQELTEAKNSEDALAKEQNEMAENELKNVIR